MTNCDPYFRKFLFSLLLLQVLNLAFTLLNNGIEYGACKRILTSQTTSEADVLAGSSDTEVPSDNSEADSEKELFPENFETGLFQPELLISLIQSTKLPAHTEAASRLTNPVAELNFLPPEAA